MNLFSMPEISELKMAEPQVRFNVPLAAIADGSADVEMGGEIAADEVKPAVISSSKKKIAVVEADKLKKFGSTFNFN